MATLSAVRVPFDEINVGRLQGLSSMKNRQNAVSAPQTYSKRKAAEPLEIAIFEDNCDQFDSENINPTSTFVQDKENVHSNKRARSTLFSNSKFTTFVKPQPSQFVLKTTSLASTSSIGARKIAKPRSCLALKTPAINTTSESKQGEEILASLKKKFTPKEYPAGRSPARSHRRLGSSLANEYKDGRQPKFGVPKSSTAPLLSKLPFDLRSAFRNTAPVGGSPVPSKESRLRTSQSELFFKEPKENVRVEPAPKSAPLQTSTYSWGRIYEETEEETNSNVMNHYTQNLDLDFDKKACADEYRGKENIAPAGYAEYQASLQANAPAGSITPSSPKMTGLLTTPEHVSYSGPVRSPGKLNVRLDDDGNDDGNDVLGLDEPGPLRERDIYELGYTTGDYIIVPGDELEDEERDEEQFPDNLDSQSEAIQEQAQIKEDEMVMKKKTMEV